LVTVPPPPLTLLLPFWHVGVLDVRADHHSGSTTMPYLIASSLVIVLNLFTLALLSVGKRAERPSVYRPACGGVATPPPHQRLRRGGADRR
jgi:hypothetical protein